MRSRLGIASVSAARRSDVARDAATVWSCRTLARAKLTSLGAETLLASVDFEEVGDVLEGFEVADAQLARINGRVERLLADDDVLREVRNLLGVPQKKVASELGVTASAIAQLESRSLESVQLGTLRRYFDALGFSMKVTVEPASPAGTTSGE